MSVVPANQRGSRVACREWNMETITLLLNLCEKFWEIGRWKFEAKPLASYCAQID